MSFALSGASPSEIANRMRANSASGSARTARACNADVDREQRGLPEADAVQNERAPVDANALRKRDPGALGGGGRPRDRGEAEDRDDRPPEAPELRSTRIAHRRALPR